jgi:hypothetical protein
MSTRRSITATELNRMRTVAINARHVYEDGREPDDEILVDLTRYVEALVDEVDVMVWRATVATMALDGRVNHDEVRLG